MLYNSKADSNTFPYDCYRKFTKEMIKIVFLLPSHLEGSMLRSLNMETNNKSLFFTSAVAYVAKINQKKTWQNINGWIDIKDWHSFQHSDKKDY